jgi:fatty acid desaturase
MRELHNYCDMPPDLDLDQLARALSMRGTHFDSPEDPMNRKQLALSTVLIAFVADEAYAVYQYGYLGFFRMMFANFATFTAMVDLIIALALILVWMGDDAEQRKVSALPYLLVTLALGSVGPLLYLIGRSGDRTDRSASIEPHAVRN